MNKDKNSKSYGNFKSLEGLNLSEACCLKDLTVRKLYNWNNYNCRRGRLTYKVKGGFLDFHYYSKK